MGRSDDELVQLAKQGDWAAWRALYEAHAGRLTVWLRSLGLDSDSEDVASEAWVTAAGKIKEFSGDSSDFAGWLFGIARNHALNARRRIARRATAPMTIDDDDTPYWSAAGGDPAEATVAFDATQQLLAMLPRREAEVVACIDVVGLDVIATAKALGISTTAVRVAHHRGLGRLRKLFP